MSRYGQTIRPIAYDEYTSYTPSIISGEQFTVNTKFMILSSKPIPKNTRIYMEFKITKREDDTLVRHIPLYIGVTKEPSYGFLLSDMCLGSIYYCNPYSFSVTPDYTYPLDIQTIERYHQNANTIVTKVSSKLGGKIPRQGTMIGLGVDTIHNKISIYTDGNLMYSFSPKSFNMKNEKEDFFFCLLNPLANQKMVGIVNYGRIAMKYKPKEYWSLYEEYYDKKESITDINCKVHFGTVYPNPGRYKDFNSKIIMQNSLAPVPPSRERIPWLVYATDSKAYSSNKTLKLETGKQSLASISYPCPYDQKIYFEFTTKEASLTLNTTTGLYDIDGIPLFVGIRRGSRYSGTGSNFFKSSEAFWVDLVHYKHTPFNSHSCVSGVTKNYTFYPLLPQIPLQPETIGFIVDIKGRYISIVTNGDIFAKVPIQGITFDKDSLYYIFVGNHIPSHINDGYTVLNSGETTLDFPYIADNKNIMTLYYFYNYLIRDDVSTYIDAFIEVLPYELRYQKFFNATIYVKGDPDKEPTPGINRLWDTYNIVSDKEPHNNARKYSSDYLNDLLKEIKIINKR
jgi:hypothetical protein